MKSLLFASLAFLTVAVTGCTVSLGHGESADIVKNQCTSDTDCQGGACWFNTCVAHDGVLSSLLLELTPPVSTTTQGLGGVRFLQMEGGFARSNEQHDLDLAGSSTVHGYIKSTCALDVTLTPEEQSYGLPASTYVTHTSAVTSSSDTATPASGACRDKLTLSGAMQEFVVDVPPGTFDVYVHPSSTGNDGSKCDPPALLSGVVKPTAGVSCYSLSSPAVQSLNVRIPWPSDAAPLSNWTVDVVHPVTGQALSRSGVTLQGAPTHVADGDYYTASLSYTQAVGDGTAGHELLRLSPPTPGDGPVIQLSLVGLVVSSPPTAPAIGPFPSKVNIDGWVWSADDFRNDVELPVPSVVTFSATSLDIAAEGVFASFSTTVTVGSDGHLSVGLLPGTYRVRAVPVLDVKTNLRFAAQEWSWLVRQDGTGTDQAGRVLLVSKAATVTGRVVSAFGAGIGGAAVQAAAASVDTRVCNGPDAGACAALPVGVLEMSLGEAAFVPRTASGVTAGDGQFSLSSVDCGGCTSDSSAAFDVTVQPSDGTRLPWVLEPGISVDQNVDLHTLHATLPIVHRGTVDLPVKGAEPTVVPGTLVRAYVIRDASGAPILDPTPLPSCANGSYSSAANSSRCIRSALQVAETRADGEGKYELVLPSSLDATSAP